MNQYQSFIFDSYAFDKPKRTISLVYKLDDSVTFTETITLPENMPIADHPDLEEALFALHLIGGISYYKTCLPKTMEIRSGSLTEDQARFWNEVYENGLGEFFYKNNVDFRGLIEFPSCHPEPVEGSTRSVTMLRRAQHDTVLIPIGGGKDSLVTIELLKKGGYDCTLLRIGQHPLIDAQAKEIGLLIWNIKRQLSSELFRLNEEGALNGHVPITAYIHFLSVVIGLVSGTGYTAFSNEESAEEGNTELFGKQINHQWSKSLAFEQMFQNYVSTYITADATCFSMLRTLSELTIAKTIAEKYPQYLPMLTSCNRNWKILEKRVPSPVGVGRHGEGGSAEPGEAIPSRWCGECPKCAFAFALFAAFVDVETITMMFGKNLFDDESLLPLYRELLGITGHKPFECVGTPEETAAAFILIHNRGEFEESVAMKMFVDECLPEITEPDEMIGEAMLQRQNHAIPDQFLPLLKDL